MTCRSTSTTLSLSCSGGNNGGAQLGYDNEGRLIGWQNAPSSPTTTVTDAYDGEGNRVVQKVTSGSSTTTTNYLAGGLAEQVVGGALTSYYSVAGVVTAVSVGGTLSYLASDGLGSVTAALSSASAVLAASQLFGLYGSVHYQSGVMPTAKGFTGQYGDSATGLDYYTARYYDPVAGQFISADSVLPGDGMDVWGLSRYAYVEGNPETGTDPSGHRVTYADPFVSYVCCNASNFVSGASAAAVFALQKRAIAIQRAVEHTVVHALDCRHNVEYYRMRNQGTSAEDLVEYATQSYKAGYLTTAATARGGGKAAQEAEAAEALMERGGGFFKAAKWLGIIGLAVGAGVDAKLSNDEWLQQHPGDTDGAKKFAAAHAAASTVGAVAGAWAGGIAGAALGGAIGSIVPGPGTVIGGYIGGFVGSAVGGYVGGAIGDWAVDTVANINDPSNPVSAVTSAVGGWLSSL